VKESILKFYKNMIFVKKKKRSNGSWREETNCRTKASEKQQMRGKKPNPVAARKSFKRLEARKNI